MKVIADFNATGLERIITSLDASIKIVAQPYGQYMQSIYDSIEHGCDDVCVLWLDFGSLSDAYKDALNFRKYDREQIESDFNDYLSMIERMAQMCKSVFVTNFVLPSFFSGTGLNNLKEGSLGFLIAKLNLSLYEKTSALQNVFCLDQSRWFHSNDFYNSKLYYAGKIPFSQKVFEAAANDIVAGVKALNGRTKKLLVLDLDNTLWGGILGDDGKSNLKLGSPGMLGEAFLAFQKEILGLKNRGVVLAIASKNYENNALDAIQTHPEMLLRLEDFSAWRINWEDKAANIVEIANELNLGLESIVFIDDNPAERSRVAESLPEVLVPEWPLDPCEYVTALRKLTCFSVASVSDEDLKKTEMFLQDKQRKTLKDKVKSQREWLSAMNMVLQVEPVNQENISRVVQLLNKTNQFNLRTRRLTQPELEKWIADGNHFVAYRLKDKFGDMGLIGMLGIHVQESQISIADFVLSCRAMGRGVEKAMASYAVEYAGLKDFSSIDVEYLQTKRNQPVFDFFKSIGVLSDDVFSGKMMQKFDLDGVITINKDLCK